MKKNKNDNSVIRKPDSGEKKQNNISQNSDSDKIRNKVKDIGEINFKKVLYGYEPEEVISYIEELNTTYESSSRMHEAKLSSLKEELVLSNRERDSYAQKYRECKSKLDAKSANTSASPAEKKEDKTEEYEAVIAALKEKIEQLDNENYNLKQQKPEENSNKIFDEFTAKIAMLESENRQLSIQNDAVKRENGELISSSKNYSELLNEYNGMLSQLELAKTSLEAKENEISTLKEELENKVAELGEITIENEKLKKAASELEIKNGVLIQRIENGENEITRLKDNAKSQAYEYADKVNALENEHAKTRLAVQKELKLHDYYINQAELTLAELTKQMEQIKHSMEDIQNI
ncbi:MAG: hypothetical protein IJE74_07685 [Clostridia bacterium]|nr:hypothetical protein [Clostridia bacterium]